MTNALKGNASLAKMNLGSNEVGNQGAWTLAKAFKGNTNLVILDLRSSEIGLEGARVLANALRGNTTLGMIRCTPGVDYD